LLLPISLCSLFWNFAFSALLVVMVPLITDVYRVDPGTFGIALSAFGLAAIAGSWTAGRSSRFVSPNLILLFGPGSSVLAVLSLFFVRDLAPVLSIYAAFFVLGFGPSMWMIVQNSVRQIVTPAALLGRVNAVIQTAIYGIRPLGALVGGAVVGATSPRTGLTLVAVAYALSFLAAAFSRLRAVTSYAELRPAAAA
jgi:predicted MFS family arabinose efflux permease